VTERAGWVRAIAVCQAFAALRASVLRGILAKHSARSMALYGAPRELLDMVQANLDAALRGAR
jgi:hypothetical protein